MQEHNLFSTTCTNPSTEQAAKKLPLNAAKEALRFTDTAGRDSDSGFLSESQGGCEEKMPLVSQI